MQRLVKFVSRRTFLKGIGTGGLSAAPFYIMGCKLAENVTAAGIPSSWDKEVDVVVVGTGTAAPAALYAHDEPVRG